MRIDRRVIARVALASVLIASVLMLGGCFLFSSPHARFTADPQFGYPPLAVQFDGSASNSPNGAIVSYAWDFGDGSTDTGASVDHTFIDKGTYAVKLTVTDSSGAVGSTTHSVQVMNHPPHPQFTVSPYIPQRRTVTTFDASESSDEDGYIVDWQWTFGDGTTGTGDVVDHIYDLAGTYTVRLTVIDDDGKANSITRNITIGGCNSCGG